MPASQYPDREVLQTLEAQGKSAGCGGSDGEAEWPSIGRENICKLGEEVREGKENGSMEAEGEWSRGMVNLRGTWRSRTENPLIGHIKEKSVWQRKSI